MLLIAGCSRPAPTSAVPAGWIDEIVLQPEQFSTLVDGESREGWIALHKGALPGALAPLPAGSARPRVALELSLAHGYLGEMMVGVWLDLAELWAKKSTIPAGSALPMVAALAALAVSDTALANTWLDRGQPYADPQVATVASELRAGGLAGVTDATPLGACLRAHQEARSSGDLGALDRACPGLLDGGRPLLQEGERALYDPLLYGTIAQARALEAAPMQGARGLDRRLFSGEWAADDRQVPPAWAPPLPSLADPDVVHPWIQQLDAQLDGWEAALRDRAPDEGLALLDELALRQVYRTQLLTLLARRALDEGSPRAAQLLTLSAADLTSDRSLSPRNPPMLYAIRANATWRQGDARAALDALATLHNAWPELRGLVETTGDLAILQTLDRQGDSKEN